jgi:hypothetical protein
LINLDQFFERFVDSRDIFNALLPLIEQSGPVEMRITKSQIAFVDEKPFAWVWIPGRYLQGKSAQLVLTFSFPEVDRSPRWKEITEVGMKFTHHLELSSNRDVDEEVRGWLERARQLNHPDAAFRF